SLTAGTHTFAVQATDAVGNTATSNVFGWTVSAAATVVLGWGSPASLPAAQTNSTAGSFAYTATGQSSLACRLDGVDLADCTSPVAVSGLADGLHTFDVVADPGTGTQVVLRHAWTVDTVV